MPIVVSVAQAIFGSFLPMLGWGVGDWRAQFLFPGFAFDTLKAAIQAGAGVPSEGVSLAIASLAFWTLVPLIAAIAWFNRQDLSKE